MHSHVLTDKAEAHKAAPMSETTDSSQISQRVVQLEVEHRDLDDVIKRLEEGVYVDQLQLRRLKRKKLLLKDMITRLKSSLIPDLPA